MRLEFHRLRAAGQRLNVVGDRLEPPAADVPHHRRHQPVPNSDHQVDVEGVVLTHERVHPRGIHLGWVWVRGRVLLILVIDEVMGIGMGIGKGMGMGMGVVRAKVSLMVHKGTTWRRTWYKAACQCAK